MTHVPYRVVIVEDQTIFRELLAEVLTADGSVEVVAQLPNGSEALSVCQQYLPDLVVLDMVLPDVPGLELLQSLLDWRSRLPVLVVTGNAKPSLVRSAVEIGARGCVAKDAPLDELRLGVARILAGGRYFCSTTSTMLADALHRAEPIGELTTRQRRIVTLVAQGRSSREIAVQLGITQKTVENHRTQIRQKLGINDVAGLTRYAVEQGLVEARS